MLNVLEHIPYEIEKMGKRILVNEPYLQLIQIALNPGQSVPPHNANSNVHLLTVQGGVHVELDGTVHDTQQGSLLEVGLGTHMRIHNPNNEAATFLVFKTPHPTEIKEQAQN
jgi:quercetin dioxygenase-like cupin family protein